MSFIDRYGVIVAAIMSALALILGFVLLAANLNQAAIVTFDKDRLVKPFVTELSRKRLGEEEAKRLSSLFARALKESLETYARDNKAIILKKEMVLASHQDITSLVANDVAAKMRGES